MANSFDFHESSVYHSSNAEGKKKISAHSRRSACCRYRSGTGGRRIISCRTAQEIIDHYQYSQEPDREGEESAQHIYQYFVDCVRSSVEAAGSGKEILLTPEQLVGLFNRAKLSEVNPWDSGRHLTFTLQKMLDIGKERERMHRKRIAQDIKRVSSNPEDDMDYRLTITTNTLISRALGLQKKPKDENK